MVETTPIRVLIVDDIASLRAISRSVAESLGAEVVGEAENGQEGIELYRDLKPDVVLLDIEMPVKDGITTLKELLDEDPAANIIMLTSVDNMGVVEDCIFAGARDYIRKDVPPDLIKSRLADEFAKAK